jgi:toxin CcdB
MPQFAVYLNKNLRSRSVFPMLVDVQAELLRDLETRVVIPLVKRAAFTSFPLGLVMPTVEIEGEAYLLVTPQLAGVSRADLGPHTGSVAAHSRAVSTAMDILLRGF